jgi:hypothetical protein
MHLLHVPDFHFNRGWFAWLGRVTSGDDRGNTGHRTWRS